MSQYDQSLRDTWLEVDLAQLRRNIVAIQRMADTALLVVVKANAYGHGLVAVSQAAQQCGVRMLGIATLGEAQIVRDHGVTVDLLRITAYGPDEIGDMIANDVHFFVWDVQQLPRAEAHAVAQGRTAHVHLKIDTGMGRVGVFPDQAAVFAAAIGSCPHLRLAGVASHFYGSDIEDLAAARRQLAQFQTALDLLHAAGHRPEIAHLANSPGLLRMPEARFDMVRSGVITYGLPYDDWIALPEQLKPVAQWKARIVSLRTLPPGHAVSYGAEYVTKTEELIGILPVGYADGFRRSPGNVNEVLIQGRRVPTIGRICMDQCLVRIPPDMRVELSEPVVLLGSQGDVCIDSLELGQRWGTNNYDAVCNISPRVPRIYQGL